MSELEPNDSFQDRGIIKVMGKDGTTEIYYVAEVTSNGEVRVIEGPLSGVTIDANPQTFEDTSFVTGDSPAILDVNAALGRNATQFSVQNDGAGNFTVATSTDGISFGDEKTMKGGEVYGIDKISVDSIRITWISNSAYRVIVL